MNDADRVRTPDHVRVRLLEHEAIVLDTRSGAYHGVDRIGGRMLAVLLAGASIGEAASLLADEYGQPVARVGDDLRVFCASLQALGLVEPAGV